ncbi:thioester domain-containing protein [Nocardiopsis composta]|uniref:thioester domain-containing protein n=1 Tax=Nocardiopsis composta TaxID=157465 RepID=UPI0028A7EB73|nr:thioester domain-containing protein [Nocardiopsis composta]
MKTTPLPDSPRRGRRIAAVAAATTAAALAFGFSAAPALASGAKGEYVGNAVNGDKVTAADGTSIGTSLFNLKLEDGTLLQTYCIDYETSIRGGAKYQEDAWENYPGKGQFATPGKVNWILQNSFPKVDVASLAEASGVEGLTEEQAVAGTQAAIWHFSNNVKFGEERNDPKVYALYTHLVKQAQDQDVTEPDASLTIAPESAEGKAGETIGEFTVTTSADSVPLTLDAPEGVELVDVETGEAVETASNGDVFGFKVPEGTEAGEASVSGTVSATVDVGRLFKGVEGQPATQTLITADGKTTEVTAGAKVSWTAGGGEETPTPEPSEPEPSEPNEPSPSEPAPSPSTPADKPDDKPAPGKDEDKGGGLPVTGGALAGLVGAAVAAVAGGGAAMYLSRKRRSASDES